MDITRHKEISMSFALSWSFRLGVLASSAVACFPRVSMADAECPCSEGYVCCANVCVTNIAECEASVGEPPTLGDSPFRAPGVTAGTASAVPEATSSTMEIERAVAPDPSCHFGAWGRTQDFGMYDSSLSFLTAGPHGYVLAYAVRYDPSQGSDAEIVGMEGCWYQYDDTTRLPGEVSLIDCSTIPKQAGFIPVGQQIATSREQRVVVFQVLTEPMLRSIFGDSHHMSAVLKNPNNLREIVVPSNPAAEASPDFSSAFGARLQAPKDIATRDRAWGERYPTHLNAPIVLQLRAVYANQHGIAGRSHWFPYLINYCPTCIANPCGYDSWQECRPATCGIPGETCGGGQPTATDPPQQTCGDSTGAGSQTQCTGLFALTQYQVTYENACLPAQGDAGTRISCVAMDACPTTVY